PHLEFRYPDDFPKVCQDDIRKACQDANQSLSTKDVGSYDEHRKARVAWFREVIETAAGAISQMEQWGDNQRRDLFREFVSHAAAAAWLRLDLLSEVSAEEWRRLDDALFARTLHGDEVPSGSGVTLPMNPAAMPAEGRRSGSKA